MARVWDSEVLNCPHVNQPINAEQGSITSALLIISPFGFRGRAKPSLGAERAARAPALTHKEARGDGVVGERTKLELKRWVFYTT